MRRIAALYHNEMIKIFRKVSVWVILGLMVVGVFGIGGLMRLSVSMEEQYETTYQDSTDQWIRENLEQCLAQHRSNLDSLRVQLAAAGDELAIMELQQQIQAAEQDVALYEEALRRNIQLDFHHQGSISFESPALHAYIEYQFEIDRLKAAPAGDVESAKALKKAEEYFALAQKALDGPDYGNYLELKNRLILDDDSLGEEEKAMQVSLNQLRLKLDPEGKCPYSMESSLSQIETRRRSLIDNINYVDQTAINAPLSAEERTRLENDIAVQMYRLENDMTFDFTTADGMMASSGVSVLFSFGIALIAILMMILAGGSISQEVSSGTIKSLIISPTRRWKIYLAKLLSLLSVGVLATLLLYVTSIASTAAWFGTGGFLPYVTASGGSVTEISFFLYQLADAFVQFIDVFVYMLFAFMLSVITRNTAASVGIAIGVYFGGEMAMVVVNQFFKGEWINFLPFSNLSLSTRFFPYSGLTSMMNGTGLVSTGPSLTFSLCYLAVLCVCMLYIAKDSFCRRDI